MQVWLATSGVSGLLAVGLGAFGAHALRGRLSADAMNWWHTAVEYHCVHTLLLLALAILALRSPASALLTAACWATVAGILLFSGSLYLMALGAPRWFGAITPAGGLAWLLAWALLAWFGARAH